MNPQVMIWTIFDFIIFLPPLILLLLDYRNFMKDDFEVTKPSLPTRNKFLITILIVIIIVFVGKWFFWSGRNIYMNTDKTEYERKKEILVTVKTELIRPVFFYNASSFCRVFHKVGGEWDISYNIDLDRYNKVGFNNYVYKWDQMHNKWHSEEKYLAPPGLYKAECYISPYPYICFIPGADMCIIDNLSRPQAFSSNEFHIVVANEEEKRLEECINIPKREERENCIKNLALEKNNKSLCEYLQPYEDKEVGCRVAIDLMNNENLAICRSEALISGNFSDECIKKIAIETGEIKQCDLSKDEEIRKKCYITVSIERNDLEMCKKLGSSDYTGWCYAGIAIKRNDPKVCYQLKQDYQYVPQDECFMDLSIYTNNSNYCSYLGYQYMKDDCFYDIATNKNDSAICELIENFNKKSDCETKISMKKYPKINQ